ncbi:hypothetical protein D9611_014479 [Ephemerocybe angulata]|uniref:C2H2-type domain-containing protein n=1 Tax=Ephemerocybe angulata TaxID=980116 RepID=A0A8H5FFA4_9AGAR|nr:hypothetical protein D9611_014479 [Tulosesus angulatus]
MRFNILLLAPTIVALATYVQGHYDEFDARDLVDELSVRNLLRRSEIMDDLAEISTRDLITELSSRLEARGGGGSKPVYNCWLCNKEFSNKDDARNHCKTINEEDKGKGKAKSRK